MVDVSDTDAVECPECGHSFFPLGNEIDIQEMKNDLDYLRDNNGLAHDAISQRVKDLEEKVLFISRWLVLAGIVK